jgi:hypothetical protein
MEGRPRCVASIAASAPTFSAICKAIGKCACILERGPSNRAAPLHRSNSRGNQEIVEIPEPPELGRSGSRALLPSLLDAFKDSDRFVVKSDGMMR